ncbi:MAG: response regulator [Bacteroidota bacterium]|nr:response regulator [Bacteroidota bacterium]MDX5429465.1 response regulator [Bacteroidota bacterium]MDX5468257.1 response regulator [Bacteroidota bacterium]
MPKIKRVCIIDDDPIFVFGIQRFMQIAELGDEFMHFGNGKLALEGLSRLKAGDPEVPDLILVDLNMPVLDGWQFLEAFTVMQRDWNPLIFIVSSSIDPVDLKRAENFECVRDFVVKPITAQKLKELVKQYNA